jgi:serine/threonine-protein kinase
VAVKFLSEAYAQDPGFVERFRQEARAAAQLRTPHAAQVFDHGVTADGAPFIVMELLEGERLESRIQRLGPLPLQEVVRIVAQAAKALTRAHQLDMVHRDIKPANLLLIDVDGEPFVKVLDFGIAKQARADAPAAAGAAPPLGTPRYMSPEQLVSAKRVDFRTDLWSLGVVAYEALTGKPPFPGEALGAVAVAVHTGEFPRPSAIRPELPAAVDAWMARALQRDPAARFASAREMAIALEQAAGPAAKPATASWRPTERRASSTEIPAAIPPSTAAPPPSTAAPTPSTAAPPPSHAGPPSSLAGPPSSAGGPPSSVERGRPLTAAPMYARPSGLGSRVLMDVKVGAGTIKVVRKHIAKAGTEAIVSTADKDLTPEFDGVSDAIHRAAGPELHEMTRRWGSCPIGGAVITGAGRIPAPTRYIIHAVGPRYTAARDAECAEQLRSAYEASLRRAEENGIRSVAFPPLSTGANGYPIEKAAPIALDAAARHLSGAARHVELIVFVLITDVSFDAFVKALAARVRG